jgi:hypothetical protein
MAHRPLSRRALMLLCLVSVMLSTGWLPASAQALSVDANGCTRWVAFGGADDSPGDRAHPWRTLQHAADSVRPGDTLCIFPGTYPIEDELDLTVSGTSRAPITLTTLGQTVTLRGSLRLARGVSHVRLKGFAVTGFRTWGITVEGDNEDLVLSALTVTGGEAGIHLTVGDSGQEAEYGPVRRITIEDSVVSGAEYTAVDCTPGPCDVLTLRRLEVYGSGAETGFAGDGIAVEQGSNVVVEDCFVHDNGGDGIDLNSRDVGRSMPGIVVRRNRVVGNGRNGIKVWAGGRVENNLIADSGSTALVLESGAYHIVNNTLANIASYDYLAMLGNYDNQHPVEVSLYNNIFYNDNAQMGGTLVFFPRLVTLHSDHNIYYNPFREEDVICADSVGQDACFGKDAINSGDWNARSRQGGRSLYADPAFVSSASGDFRLAAGSPAVDAGSATQGASTDLSGAWRDERPDIGAYEYRASTGSG